MADEQQPIIIKKINKGGHGHHGGAWKVAYADFVTAMMAFFLLLWLLNSTTSDQKAGIAEYFTPTMGVQGQMGVGFEGGTNPLEDKARRHSDLSPPGIVFGSVPGGPLSEVPTKSMKNEYENESKSYEEVTEEIYNTFDNDSQLTEFIDNIVIEQTEEGLRIQLKEDEGEPLFEKGSARFTPFAKKGLTAIINVVKGVPNRLSVEGHTDSRPFYNKNFTNWELSSARANATRRFMMENGIPFDQVAKVVGMADQDLLVPRDPTATANRRIALVLIKGSLLPYYKAPAPQSLLAPPRPKRLEREEPQEEKVAPTPEPEKKEETPPVEPPDPVDALGDVPELEDGISLFGAEDNEEPADPETGEDAEATQEKERDPADSPAPLEE